MAVRTNVACSGLIQGESKGQMCAGSVICSRLSPGMTITSQRLRRPVTLT